MDIPRDRIDWPPLEWKPSQVDGEMSAEELQVLQRLVVRFYDSIANNVRPESPDFSVWFGENHITASARLPELDPDSVRIALSGQTLVLRGQFRKVIGAAQPARTFQKIFMLPYAVDPGTVHVNWMLDYLVIQAYRLQQDRPQAA